MDLIHLPPPSTWTLLSETGQASIHRVNLSSNSVIVKLVPLPSPPPHSVEAEVRCLGQLAHDHVVPLLACFRPPQLSTCALVLPDYPLTLHDVLVSNDPFFAPPAAPLSSPAKLYYTLSRRILAGIAAGLAHLHHLHIAHRDLCPANICLKPDAHPVLIDFGTVWDSRFRCDPVIGHTVKTLEFELGTMPYRAPELLFGSRSYSAIDLDLWSLGVILAEFFTPFEPLHPHAIVPADEPPSASTADQCPALDPDSPSAWGWYTRQDPDLMDSWAPSDPGHQQPTKLRRKTLFAGDLGDIGLVGSIFKILGTPDHVSWPEAKLLPDFSKLTFHNFQPQPLRNFLPYTSPGYDEEEQLSPREDIPPATQPDLWVDLVSRLLVYSASKRAKADEILNHPVLKASLREHCAGNSESMFREAMKQWIS